jgi:pimeloyl-ACP methyl ester carboxylesterase
VNIKSSGIPAVIATLLMQAVCGAAVGAEPAPAPAAAAEQRLEIGHFHARAILRCSALGSHDGMIVILIPGTGAHGPEEAMPAVITSDGKETQILTSVAKGLRDAGLHTLQLGKPGIDFHTTWDLEKVAYDKPMYDRLTWDDLLQNVDEAVDYIATQHPCGASKIVLLGHSEGTSRGADAAARNPRIRGLIFLGFHGHSLKDMVDYQAYRRTIELLVKPDIDADHDGFITREEAARWPKDFTYAWKDGESRISIEAYEAFLRSNTDYQHAINDLAQLPMYSNGIWDRSPIYSMVAHLPIPVLAFTGSLDVMTPPSELKSLQDACTAAAKRDCETHLVPGLGHGMSPPKPPRGHLLLDQTEGPVDAQFLDYFSRTVATWKDRIR